MSRKHLEISAKLWALALVAHTDSLDADPLAQKVRRLASKRATTELRRLGTSRGQIQNEQDAANEALRLMALQKSA